MKIIGIIPARYGSTRLPGKPLLDIKGKPMLLRVYERVRAIDRFDKIVAATDDERILNLCKNNNIPAIMTDNTYKTAADRLWEVSESEKADFYVQINGDEPLINTEAVVKAVPSYVPQNTEFGTNIVTEIKDTVQLMSPTNIKVVFDSDNRMLYMSRTPIPYPYKEMDYEYYKHVGIIGYNKKMLDFYHNSVPGKLEVVEGIDTLRFIDYGKELKAILCSNMSSFSVDTYEDLKIMRERFNEQHN